jgi:hypothetical protein
VAFSEGWATTGGSIIDAATIALPPMSDRRVGNARAWGRCRAAGALLLFDRSDMPETWRDGVAIQGRVGSV